MQNLLLLFCRKNRHLTPKQVAVHLGVSVELYKELENGELLMTESQARRLACLYQIPPWYFLEAARQLDFLLTSRVNIRILKFDNDRLRDHLARPEVITHLQPSSAN